MPTARRIPFGAAVFETGVVDWTPQFLFALGWLVLGGSIWPETLGKILEDGACSNSQLTSKPNEAG